MTFYHQTPFKLSLFMLILVAHSALIRQLQITIGQLQQLELTPDQEKQKALELLRIAHPEMKDYQELNANLLPKENSDPAFRCYSLTLQSTDGSVLAIAIVNFYTDKEENSVVLQKYATQSHEIRQGTKEITQFVSKDSIDSSSFKGLGSGVQFMNFDDLLYGIALGHLLKKHPNLQSYWLVNVEVKLVAGTLFKFVHLSPLNVTFTVSWVKVDLKRKPSIISFDVIPVGVSAKSESNQTATAFYIAEEKVIKQHPEIINFKIHSRVVQSSTQNSIIVVITYDNQIEKLRSMAEVTVTNLSTATIGSFYTYSL